ncbi:MAG: DUF4926 domain-containing protein [Hydrogenophilaceae bacterium]|jgi:hypothetical protein|nr:DUF4926 domain-containing protein [Hydrogenophilaceae bacterium]
MDAAPQELDVVALLTDRPDLSLARAQTGTIVGRWADDVWEVEFVDPQGRTYAMAALPTAELLVLPNEPAPA